MKKRDKFYCPCCGYFEFAKGPGSWEVCPICCWEDDLFQFEDPECSESANSCSLITARRNFSKYGAVEKEFVEFVRKPTLKEIISRKKRSREIRSGEIR